MPGWYVLALIAGLLALAGNSAAQEAVLPAELQRVHFIKEARYPFLMQVERITKDRIDIRYSPHLETSTTTTATIPVGGRLPGGEFVLARIDFKEDASQGFKRVASKATLQNAHTKREYTRDFLTDSEEWLTVRWVFTLVYSDGSRLPREEGEKFGPGLNDPEMYEVEKIHLREVTVRRLADGQEFALPVPGFPAQASYPTK